MKKLLFILLSVFLFGCSDPNNFEQFDDEGNLVMKVLFEGKSPEDPNYVLISKECWDNQGNQIDCAASEYWDVAEESDSE